MIESIRGSYDDPHFYKQITITLNPWSDKHWIKPAFFDEETQRDDTFAITTTYKCNEWLDDGDRKRYENLWKTNPSRAAVVANGDWGVAEGLVFENYEVKDFDIQAKIKEIGETTAGMDFGFTNDPTTFPRLAVDLKNHELWIYAEHYEHAMTTTDIYNLIKSEDMMKARIIADSAEPRLITELRQKGVRRIQASVKGKDSIRTGIDFMKQFKIYIHPSCEYTIEEFDTYTYKQDKEGNWLNEPIDANNHVIDAIRYALEPYHLRSEQRTDVRRSIKNIRRIL